MLKEEIIKLNKKLDENKMLKDKQTNESSIKERETEMKNSFFNEKLKASLEKEKLLNEEIGKLKFEIQFSQTKMKTEKEIEKKPNINSNLMQKNYFNQEEIEKILSEKASLEIEYSQNIVYTQEMKREYTKERVC